MRIGIELNGVLRDTLGKIEQIYRKNYLNDENLDSYKTYEIDLSGNTEEIINEDTFKYEINLPIVTNDLQNHFKFKTQEDLYSFLYQEFPMEIFGHAGSVETATFNYFNDFYLKYRDTAEILVVSDEIGKSKPASLFFLSKFGCLTEKIKFYSLITLSTLWDEVDVLVTANNNLITNCPKDKIIIKYNTTYNTFLPCKYQINSLKELDSVIETISLS